MNRRMKHKIVLMAWLALFFILGFCVWSFQAGHLMILIYLVLSVLVYGVYAVTARCPGCGMPILLRPVRLCRMQLYLWSLTAPERCRHCGGGFREGSSFKS